MKDFLMSVPTPYIAVVLLALSILFVAAVKAGYLELHWKGIDIERPSKGNEPTKNTPPLTDNRVILHKMVRFTEDYVAWCKREVSSSIKKEYGTVNSTFVTLVCEKIFDRALVWIILNHIEDTDKYKNQKINETYRVIIATAEELAPERAETEAYQALIMKISRRFVSEFVEKMCEFKAEEAIERNEK